jgi:hypothetical protein
MPEKLKVKTKITVTQIATSKKYEKSNFNSRGSMPIVTWNGPG